ncbi:MAG: peptidylprolyl isomerase [Gammaproteobacteria bacterium]|nr:peptidylprolyl isomerase [Gammaproteobacteria bacterium]
MTIKQNSVVTMHYELKDAEGELLDSSKGQEPLVYLHGASNIIVGLEEQLEGKQVGDRISARVSPEKGYGMPVEALVQQVPTAAFGDDIAEIEVGMRFQAETEQGPVPVVVKSIVDGMVTVDGNHPLAGKELHFECSISEVREASQEEIEHGHVHGPGGHAH